MGGGGQVAKCAIETPTVGVSQEGRAGGPEQTSGTFEIFSRAILFGTLLQIYENIVFRDYMSF